MYICKSDSSGGADGSKPAAMRAEEPPDKRFLETDDIYGNPNDNPSPGTHNPAVTKCSYLYEFCGATCSWKWQGFLGANGSATLTDVDSDTNGVASWGEVKNYQMTHGDTDNAIYDETAIPIIRCFQHYTDRKVTVHKKLTNSDELDYLTINVAYSGNIFQAGMGWEDPVVE